MGRKVLQVENVGKLYRLGKVGSGTLREDINRWWAGMRGKEDPFLKLGETNDRQSAGNSDFVWALRHVNIEVEEGQVLGIIGKNGAGKSTLLKILSRVTWPTEGFFRARGRIASLLEVGTGFHPDLSGRENVFLNGAILGMRKAEIKRKFDEIVAFAGVERYIDTPVKRYSSGMYVRLAFAVAAHLETDILIIDEVLAVGDMEFQKKCLGKMKDVAVSGRTVLFVSHNMTAINNLCERTILMQHGHVAMDGDTLGVVSKYLDLNEYRDEQGNADRTIVPEDWERPWGQVNARFKKIELLRTDRTSVTDTYFLQPFCLRVTFAAEKRIENAILQVRIVSPDGQQISLSNSKFDTGGTMQFEPGEHVISVELDPRLMPGQYSFNVFLSSEDGTVFYDAITGFLKFNVKNMSETNTHYLSSKINTFVLVPGKWEILN